VTSKENISSATLRTFLKENLPDYMMPAHFVRLEKMPLMSNDKLDLKYLMERKDEKYLASDLEYESPSTEVEKIISRVWREVLCLEEISRHDHFFELGGNSLNVVQVNEKLKEELNMEINIVTLFRYDTIYSLAKELYEQEEKKERGNAPNRALIRESSRDRLLKRRSRKRE
jgi:fengycin family lipopeptide synthetase D